MGRRSVIVAVALLGSISPALGQEVRGAANIVVVDSLGKTVGGVASLQGPAGAVVGLEVDGQLVVLQVTHDRFIGNADTAILYESSDCSGSAYVSPGPISFGPSLAAVVIGPPGATAYVGNPNGPLVPISWRSWQNLNSEECNPQVPAAHEQALPVTPLVDLSEHFTPPFSLIAVTAPPATATPTPSPSPAPPATTIPTDTAQPTATSTTLSLTATPTTIPVPAACCGDCNADGEVRVEELVSGINRLLNGCGVP